MAEVLSKPTPDAGIQPDLPPVEAPESPPAVRRPRSTPGQPKHSRFMDGMQWVASKGSIVGNWVMDFILVALALISLAPEIWSALAMVFLAFILATFLVTSILRRNKGLYVVLVVLIGFFDISVILTALDRQHNRMEHPGVDTRLERLQNQTADAQTAYDALLAQQNAAGNRKTLDNLDGQIRFAQNSLEEAKLREASYVDGGLMALAVDPRVLAMAIPSALFGPSWADRILFAVVLMLFIAMQWTLRVAMGVTVKRARAESRTTVITGKRRRRGKRKPKGLDLN